MERARWGRCSIGVSTWSGHVDGEPAAAKLVRVWGSSETPELTVDDVRAVIAKEHGFADWAAVTADRDRPVDLNFEAAVDAEWLTEYALIYSAGLGRREIVEFLLTRDP